MITSVKIVAKTFLDQKTGSIAHTNVPTPIKKGLKITTEKIVEHLSVRDAAKNFR
jgi:hypothetical protein